MYLQRNVSKAIVFLSFIFNLLSNLWKISFSWCYFSKYLQIDAIWFDILVSPVTFVLHAKFYLLFDLQVLWSFIAHSCLIVILSDTDEPNANLANPGSSVLLIVLFQIMLLMWIHQSKMATIAITCGLATTHYIINNPFIDCYCES